MLGSSHWFEISVYQVGIAGKVTSGKMHASKQVARCRKWDLSYYFILHVLCCLSNLGRCCGLQVSFLSVSFLGGSLREKDKRKRETQTYSSRSFHHYKHVDTTSPRIPPSSTFTFIRKILELFYLLYLIRYSAISPYKAWDCQVL